MTSLAAFGTFFLAAIASVWKLYQYFVKQFERRRREIADKAVADYREQQDMATLRREVEELRKRGNQS